MDEQKPGTFTVSTPFGDVQLDVRAVTSGTAAMLTRDASTQLMNETKALAEVKDFKSRLDTGIFNSVEVDQLRSDDCLIKGLMYMPGITLNHSDPGVGKSFTALDLAFHVALGRATWCGFRIKRRVRVLYIYSEGGSRLWKRRDAWLTRNAADSTEAAELAEWMHFYPRSVPLTGSESIVDALLERIKNEKYGLIIFDTWATSTTGADENSAGAMGVALERLGRIRDEAEAAILVIHHDNKGGGYRGSTSLDGYVDTRLHTTREGSAADRKIKITIEKQRDDASGIARKGHLDIVSLGVDEDGDPITSVVFVYGEPATSEESPTPAEKRKVFDMQAVAESIWLYIQATANDPDDDAWSSSDIARKPHTSLVGTQAQRKKAIERMKADKVLYLKKCRKTRENGRALPFERLVPCVDAEGRFAQLSKLLESVD
ncbi:helicase RepA family protein [Umezawaea endophytica]|uniref:Helicase RepA family protein n=1 Tax=Umezawaea endophytica TaxID=1654476 RepID=A0A9X2VJ09_9PSEU|nr:helicase RepA family protein [Umezawaea endophytica]MCS7477498.1 helicase RepA family protein [Umezawaea endophytica]